MKILAFSPHAAIWSHAFPEALLLEALKQEGHDILYVSCRGQFSGYCIPMSAYGLAINSPKEEKEKICSRCRNYKEIIKKEFGFTNATHIEDVLLHEDHENVARTLASLTKENFIELCLDNIPVGRYALYEFLINAKKDSVELTDAEWLRFQPELSNSLYAFFACRRLLDREKPDRVALYNSYYSVNHICCELAAQRGILHYFLHAGNNLSNRTQTMLVARGYALATWNRNPHWGTYKHLPCSAEMLSSVTDHMLSLFKGLDAFAYSAPKAAQTSDLRQRFGVKPGQKVLLATMSSTDERVAAEAIGVFAPDLNCIFPSQVEWVRAIIDYVKERKEYCLILRVHPRNFPNKRERLKSAQAELLEKMLRDLPDNVRVNWPADAISLYDMAEIADVILNGWSNAGKEMGLLGLPVVLYSFDLIPAYPPDLNYVGNTLESYFAKIEEAIADGWSFENIRKTYRWCAFEYYRSLINISESYTEAQQVGLTIPQRAIRKLGNLLIPNRLQIRDCRRRAPELKAKMLINRIFEHGSISLFDEMKPEDWTEVGVEQETSYLKHEIGRLARAMYGSELKVPANGLGEKLKRAI